MQIILKYTLAKSLLQPIKKDYLYYNILLG